MRVIFGIGNYSYGYGIAHAVQTITKELVKRGIDVLILAGKSNIKLNVPLIECGYNEVLRHAYVTKTVKTILRFKPDIFHSHYYPMDFCGALLSSKIKHVLHIHGVLEKEHWFNKIVALECLRSSLSEKIGVRFSAKVIAVSRFLRNKIIRKFGMKEYQVEVIYPCVDMNLFSNHNRSRFHRVTDGDVNLVSVGAISHRKGQHLLIDAMREVITEAPKTRLVLVGRIGQEDTTYITQLRQRIRKFGLEKNVLLKGFVSMGRLPLIYASADIFITGTKWEGFGLPVAEAMASGIPVVAFDTGSIHELIQNEYNGLKAPPFNTNVFSNMVLRLIHDERLRRKMGKNARQFAQKKFSTKNVHRLVQIYRSLNQLT